MTYSVCRKLVILALCSLALIGCSDEDPTEVVETPGTEYAELPGTWDYHSLRSGNTEQWRHGIEQIDLYGAVTRIQNVRSDGTTDLGVPYSLTIDANQVVQRLDVAHYHGVMSQDRNLIVGTRSKDSGQAYRLELMLKRGGTFATGDLVGDWDFHSLSSGSVEQWQWGTEGIDDEGGVSAGDGFRGVEDPAPGAAYSLVIDAEGTITHTADASYHAVMSRDKTMIVATYTRDSGQTYRLEILQKRGGTYAVGDLAGTWRYHSLRSGNTEQWRHGTEQIDAGGNVTRVENVRSNGDTTLGDPYTLEIDADGVVTRTDQPTYHGRMSPDKKMIVYTRSKDSGQAYRLEVMLKAD